tara:strand:+ start:83 stop:508 length:426 start_codon:yes stop_codon:yes gene_type:complete
MFFSNSVLSIEKGKWTFVKEDNWCYIGSIPLKEEGDYTQRGDTYLIAFRINKDPEITIQVNAGYNYDESKLIKLVVDQTSFELFGQGDSAWSRSEDKEIIYAMVRGKSMTIQGVSSRGTLTKDSYTLIGFTAAYNKLKKDC